MTSLDRARRFLAAKVGKLALTAVPLAAIAVSVCPAANAGTIVPGNCQVKQGQTSGGCSLNQISPAGGDPNLNWVELDTSNNAVDAVQNVVELSASGLESAGLQSGEIIPVAWDFTIQGNSDPGTATWALTFTLDGTTGGPYTASETGGPVAYQSSTNAAVITGSDNIVIPSLPVADTLTGFSIDLTVTGTNNFFDVIVPSQQTLDLNPSFAPEPVSMVLAGTGLLATLLLKRRRKA